MRSCDDSFCSHIHFLADIFAHVHICTEWPLPICTQSTAETFLASFTLLKGFNFWKKVAGAAWSENVYLAADLLLLTLSFPSMCPPFLVHRSYSADYIPPYSISIGHTHTLVDSLLDTGQYTSMVPSASYLATLRKCSVIVKPLVILFVWGMGHRPMGFHFLLGIHAQRKQLKMV